MKEQNDDPNQSQQYENPPLQPIEDILKQGGYPPPVIENYAKLSRKELHLAEYYRLANAPIDAGEGKMLRVNPIQASIDSEGKIHVDVLLELNEGVTVKELYEIMEIHAVIGRFVAGRILADRAPELIEKAACIETSRPIAPTLYQSVPSIQADQATLTQEFPAAFRRGGIDGRGVIIGIIDHGCDYKHQAFLKNGQTRLLYIWDQTGSGGPKPAAPFNYGVEYDQASINQALQSNTNLQLPLDAGAHGTHVMGIAAGNTQNIIGVAPAADLIFVHLGNAANQTGQPLAPAEAGLKTLGSSWNLFNAVLYILEKANQLNKPVVINISQGGNGGPHDGTTIVERMFDTVLAQSGRAIVVAAGNSRDDGIHTSGEVPPGGPKTTISWNIDKESPLTSEIRHEMEIWYERNGALTLRLLDPYGVVKAKCRLDENPILPVGGGSDWPVMVRNQRPSQPGEDENLINIFVDNRGLNPGNEAAPKHVWRVELSQDPETNANVGYHAWIERNDPSQSSFAIDSQTRFTLNTIGNAALPIVVGAYDSHSTLFPDLDESGEGPTLNQKMSEKPDVSAPGWRIFSANAQTVGDGITKSGTSMAAPHVSGLIALMFQAARDLKNPPKTLDSTEIRAILLLTCDKNPPAGEGHHPQYGFGRINALKAIEETLK
jgi:subtilisin family serine protease